MKWLLFVWFAACGAAQSWIPQESGTTASLRGVSAVDANVVWASGTNATFLRTTDGGVNWKMGQVAGAGDADFRAIRAIDARTAFLLTIGNGEESRI